MEKPAHLHVSVDCVVFGYDDDGLKVLIIDQRKPQGMDTQPGGAEWQLQAALPGDLVLENESLEEAAARVLHELTGLENIFLKQFHSFGDPDRVRQEKDQKWLHAFRTEPDIRVMTIAYYGLVSLQDYVPQPAGFAGSARWLDLGRVPGLAFDHNRILETAVDTLREQLESHHISFELLPKKFTLSQFQALHEIVLNKKFDKRNFRKNVKRMVHIVPLDEKQQGVLHKPAQLFTYQPDLGKP